MPREIIVVKKPRDTPLQDKPVSFATLQNLHLDMMEIKKKLKKNLPLIVVKPSTPAAKDGSARAKAVKYPASIISGTIAGVAGAATGAAVAAASEEKENFVEDLVEAEASKPRKRKKKVEPAVAPAIAPEEPQEGDDMDNLKDDGEDATPEEAPPGDGGEEDAAELGDDAGEDAGEGETPHTPEDEDDPYAGMSPEERERAEKEEYIWRFKILKKKYKTRKDIPDYGEHDDLFTMKQNYERTLREIQLEDNCESYRMYLIGGFMLMEFISNNWMGVDLTGFTAHQMTIMDKYDRMLIELGEKSYNRWGSNLPVEIRLIGFIIIQAGIFYLGKIVSEKGGGAMADIFKMFTGTPAPAAAKGADSPAAGEEQAPKKKMRGPSVKVADLKKRVADE